MILRWLLRVRIALFFAPFSLVGQTEITRYNAFEIKGQDVVWQHAYSYTGDFDSLRTSLVQMLKSKYYTFNVVRTPEGYSGELHHYKVNCRKYGRTYRQTPRMYWDGEWKGKFIVEATATSYRVTVYGLYYERKEQVIKSNTTEKTVKGRYFDAVTSKNKNSLRKNEFINLTLMGLSLKDEFDIKNTTSPQE